MNTKVLSNGDKPISPTSISPGLTKREWLAGIAMQGLLASNGSRQDICTMAIEQANILLAALGEKE